MKAAAAPHQPFWHVWPLTLLVQSCASQQGCPMRCHACTQSLVLTAALPACSKAQRQACGSPPSHDSPLILTVWQSTKYCPNGVRYDVPYCAVLLLMIARQTKGHGVLVPAGQTAYMWSDMCGQTCIESDRWMGSGQSNHSQSRVLGQPTDGQSKSNTVSQTIGAQHLVIMADCVGCAALA